MEKKGFKSPFAMFRDASKQVSDTMSSYKKSAAQKEREAAWKYEKKRIQMENDKYMARKGEAQWKQEQKKAGKK